jgi:protein-S-isoprenylcysteine O-methyltransferase Ste14
MYERDPNQITIWSNKLGLAGIPFVIGITLIFMAHTSLGWEPVMTGVGILACLAGLAGLLWFWRTL